MGKGGQDKKYLVEIVISNGKIRKAYTKNPEKVDELLGKTDKLLSLLNNSQDLLLETKKFIIRSGIKSLEARLDNYKNELDSIRISVSKIKEEGGGEGHSEEKILQTSRVEKESRKEKKAGYLSAGEISKICGVSPSFVHYMKLPKCEIGKHRYGYQIQDVIKYVVNQRKSEKRKETLENLRKSGYEKEVDTVILETQVDRKKDISKPNVTGEDLSYREAMNYLEVPPKEFGKYMEEGKIKIYGKDGNSVFKKSELENIKKEIKKSK